MQKMALGIFISSLAITAHASSNICTSNLGKMECAAGEIDSINHLGDLNLTGTHVLGKLTVIGNVDANNAQIGNGEITGIVDASHLTVDQQLASTGRFNTSNSIFNGKFKNTGNLKSKNDLFNDRVEVVGDVDLNNASLKKESEFTGILMAKFSHFSAPILLNTCESTLNHSTSQSIFLSAQKNCTGRTEVLRLQDQTQVKGDVHFASSNGKVYLSKDSLISGRVIGGVVVRE